MELIKKVQQLILGLVVLLAFGCGKDDDGGNMPDPNVPANQKCKLTELNIVYNQDVYVWSYLYNNAGQVEKVKSTENGKSDIELHLVYDAAGRVSKIIELNDSSQETCQYNIDGLLIKLANHWYNSGTGQHIVSTYTTYEYNNQKQLIKMSDYDPLGNILREYSTFTYPTASTVLREAFHTSAGTPSLQYTEEITYDNKNGFDHNLGILRGYHTLLSPHNILKSKTTRINPVRVDSTTNTYTYNTNGFPVTNTSMSNGNSAGNPLTPTPANKNPIKIRKKGWR